MYQVNTSIRHSYFEGCKEAFITEIKAAPAEWIELYCYNENRGVLLNDSTTKQRLSISFVSDARRYYIRLFSNIHGFTLSGHETISFLFENELVLSITPPVGAAGKLVHSPIMGHELKMEIHAALIQAFRDYRLARVLIENNVLAQPAMILFNPTLSPLYSTERAGQMILQEMAEKIIGARVRIATEENVIIPYGHI